MNKRLYIAHCFNLFRLLVLLLFGLGVLSCKKSQQSSSPAAGGTFMKVYDLGLIPGPDAGDVFNIFSDAGGNAYLIGSDTDFYIIKFDKNGNYLFKKELGAGGVYDNNLYSIKFDGSYFYFIRASIAGYAYLQKTDLNGNLLVNAKLDNGTMNGLYIFNNSTYLFQNWTDLLPNGNLVILDRSIDSTGNPNAIKNILRISFFSGTGAYVGTTYLDTIPVDTTGAYFSTHEVFLTHTSSGECLAAFESMFEKTFTSDTATHYLYFYFINGNGAQLDKRAYPVGTFNFAAKNSLYDAAICFGKSDNTCNILVKTSTDANPYAVIDTALNIVGVGNINFPFQSLQQAGNGYLALIANGGVQVGLSFPENTVVTETGADFSPRLTTVFRKNGGSLYITNATVLPDNTRLFFGAIQGIGKTGYGTFQNVLIKTDANEKY